VAEHSSVAAGWQSRAHDRIAEDLTLRDVALKPGFVTAEQLDEWVRPEDMTHPL
jgi:fumarate hydratase class II